MAHTVQRFEYKKYQKDDTDGVEMEAPRVKMGVPRETKNETISKNQKEGPTDSKNETC